MIEEKEEKKTSMSLKDLMSKEDLYKLTLLNINDKLLSLLNDITIALEKE